MSAWIELLVGTGNSVCGIREFSVANEGCLLLYLSGLSFWFGQAWFPDNFGTGIEF